MDFIENSCIKELFVSVNFQDTFFLTCLIIDTSRGPLCKIIKQMVSTEGLSLAFCE